MNDNEGYADESKLKNFTPLMDILVQRFGLVTAAVYGRVWRYAQQKSRTCRASHDTIAAELNIDRRTVLRHLQMLCENGYLEDTTPDLKNKPHTYRITSKIRLIVTVEAVTENDSTVIKSHSTVTESHSDGDLKSLEERIKETKKETPKRKKESAPSAPRDPLLDDERIKSYRAVLHITPNHKQRELIANTVKDEKKWLDTLAYWAYHGYNPRDAANVVDCYTKGGAYRQGGKPAPREKTPDEYKRDAERYGLDAPDAGDDTAKPEAQPQPKREPDYWQRLVELVFQGKPPRDKIGRAVEKARYAGITPDGTMEVIAACDEDRLLLEGRVLPYARQYVHLLDGGSIARVAFVGEG